MKEGRIEGTVKQEEQDEEEEDEEALPHSEFLDIFEEGLALIVQDPLLCDLPIQVCGLRPFFQAFLCRLADANLKIIQQKWCSLS